MDSKPWRRTLLLCSSILQITTPAGKSIITNPVATGRAGDCPLALPAASPHADDPPRYAMIRPKGETKIARNLRPEPVYCKLDYFAVADRSNTLNPLWLDI
jgi:hypothetical protein